MKTRGILFASAAVLLLVPAAFAQSSNNSNNQQPNSTARADIRDALGKAGYTGIDVMPGSFIIRAKDKTGNPVLMTISPDSFSQVTELENGSGNGNSATGSVQHTGSSQSGTFVSIPGTDEMSSNIVGLDVYNSDNKDIGKIQDIAMNPRGRTQSYILSVGGFLGMGEHYVAVNPSAVKISYDQSAKKWHAAMNATVDQLKSAPEFKYNGRWNASHS